MTFHLNHDEGLIGRATFFVDHGLLMIEDPESSDLHDGWDAASEYVSIAVDSIYLSVQPSVDGPVEIGIFKSDDASDFVDGAAVYFDGSISTGSGWIIIHDANDVMRFTVRRPKGSGRVKVLVDRAGLASIVRIALFS